MKLELKRKTVEQEKTETARSPMKSVRLMGVGVYGGNDFWKIYVLHM